MRISTELLVRARALQNEYALAIDTRDWSLFASVFSTDVHAVYPRATYRGRDSWVREFGAVHEAFGWTRHEMTNHIAGADEDGAWAACYGFVEWAGNKTPHLMSTARVLYRDRLREDQGRWVIAYRELRLLSIQPDHPLPEGLVLTESLERLGSEVVRPP